MIDGRLRAGAALAATLLVAGLAACGDSGDDSAPAAQTTTDTVAVAGDEEQVAATMRELRERYNAHDGKGFCELLTPEGKAEVRRVGTEKQVPAVTRTDCPGVVEQYSTAAGREGITQQPIEVVKVRVTGDRARMVMKGGLAGIRSVVPFRLRKVDGEWLVVDPLSATLRIIRVDPK